MTHEEREAKRRKIAAERIKQRQQLLERLGDEMETSLYNRLSKCGNPISLTCTCCGRERLASSRCDNKWCPSCQHALAMRTVERMRSCVTSMKWPTLVTLTVKNYGDFSIDFMRATRKAFGKLRRLRWWKKCVRGGIAAFEVTNKGKGWHPHVHALIDCRWLSVTVPAPMNQGEVFKRGKEACKEVQQQWELCTGRPARNIQVRRVYKRDNGDPAQAVREVMKYSVKGTDLVKMKAKVGPLIRMISATRLVTTFGCAYGKAGKRCKLSLPCECGEFASMVPTEIVDAWARKSKRR